MRALAILFATVPVLGAVIHGLIVLILLTLSGWDADEDTQADPNAVLFLGVLTVAVLLTAVVFLSLVAIGNARWATATLVVHGAVTVALLVFWLHEIRHSDGLVFAYWLVFAAFGLIALFISRKEARTPRRSSALVA